MIVSGDTTDKSLWSKSKKSSRASVDPQTKIVIVCFATR